MSDIIKEAVNAIGSLLTRHNKELITVMRQPTPIKVTFNVTADANGIIGGGLSQPQPVTMYQCPMSQEAWINRFAVTAAGHTPGNPLNTGQGQIWISGSTMGEPMFWLPVAGTVAPIMITEGRLSAPHLNPGEQMFIVGDTFPPNQPLRFDMQIVLVQGVSGYTPKHDNKLMDVMP